MPVPDRLRRFAQDLITLLRDTVTEWRKDNASTLGAALAFYTVFSLAPVLVIIITIAGTLYSRQAAESNIVAQMRYILGSGPASTIEAILSSASIASGSLLTTIIGIVALIGGATAIFSSLKDALNVVWRAEPPQGNSILHYLQTRLLAFIFVAALGLLVVVAIAADSVLGFVIDHLGGALPGLAYTHAQGLLHTVFSLVVVRFGLITLLVAAIFKTLPDVTIAWRDVWIGSAVTTLLLLAGQLLFGLYLYFSAISSAYGAAGSLVVILVWVYYSAQVFFFGAEFTYVYAGGPAT